MKKNINALTLLIAISLLLSSCTPQLATTSPATPTQLATISPATPTQHPSATPTATLIPLPPLTLEPGDFYFSLDGTQRMLFSRNAHGQSQEDFNLALDWARQGGSKLLRVHLTHGWGGIPWYTTNGVMNEAWAEKWDHFFDQAQADGFYIIPVFGVWADWNNGIPDIDGPYWRFNPFNQTNGGPFNNSWELFQPDSLSQKAWMEWVKTLVERWQGRNNIAAWEIFSEINIASGAPGNIDANGAVAESIAEGFTNKAAAIIRAADSKHRPVTLSLAGLPGTDRWGKFYGLETLDFVQIHPYHEQLDREIITEIHNILDRYQKPVMIGESGLLGGSAILPNASIGVSHAIWAGVVSGAMNGRGLWSNDGYAFDEPDHALAIQYMELYAKAELPAVNFSKDVDFAGFNPLTVSYSTGTLTWGAAVGNEHIVLGWFRDAASEPPDWNLRPIPAGQTVTIAVPGTAANWQVDFYNTKTGTTVIGSSLVTRYGNTVTVTLPEFQDDIAFKMFAGAENSVITPEVVDNTDEIAGAWNGTITSTDGTFSTPVELSIQPGCESSRICGIFSAPQLPCSGDLFLQEIDDQTYIFLEQNVTGAASCTSGGYEYLQLQPDGTLAYKFAMTFDSAFTSSGILNQH